MKKFLHAIFYAAIYCCALLPFWLLYRVADITFPVLYHVIRYRRKTVAANLRESFPEKSERELKQIERKFYRNFADYIFETIKLLIFRDYELCQRMCCL